MIELAQIFKSAGAIGFEENSVQIDGVMTSMATGNATDHERLWYTRKGHWVLQQWQDGELFTQQPEEVSYAHASKWLVVNDCLPDAEFLELPPDLQRKLLNERHNIQSELDGGPSMDDGIMPLMPPAESEWDDE